MQAQPRTDQHEAAAQTGVVVELSRAKGDDLFTCTLPDWNFIRDLALTFGWHPAGTTYLPQHGQQARRNPIKHDYLPGDSQDSKRVEADDSAQLAAALDGAKRSPFLPGMLRTHAQLQDRSGTEQPLQLQLQTFIQFARRGTFTIALKLTHDQV
jgi:hypothetical protein